MIMLLTALRTETTKCTALPATPLDCEIPMSLVMRYIDALITRSILEPLKPYEAIRDEVESEMVLFSAEAEDT